MALIPALGAGGIETNSAGKGGGSPAPRDSGAGPLIPRLDASGKEAGPVKPLFNLNGDIKDAKVEAPKISVPKDAKIGDSFKGSDGQTYKVSAPSLDDVANSMFEQAGYSKGGNNPLKLPSPFAVPEKGSKDSTQALPDSSTPDTYKSIENVTKGILGLPKAIYDQEANPSAEVLQQEKLFSREGTNSYEKAAYAIPNTLFKGVYRFFQPMFQPMANQLSMEFLQNSSKARSNLGVSLSDLENLPGYNEGFTQKVGDVVQAVLAIYMPEMYGAGAAKVVNLGVRDAFIAGIKHSAPTGILFGVAQAASSGQTDPGEITKTILVSTIGLSVLGGITHAAIPSSKATFRALTKQVMEEYNLPHTVYLDPTMIYDHLSGRERSEFIQSLNMTPQDLLKARKTGMVVEAPLEKIVTMTDKPWFSKVKDAIGLKATFERQGGMTNGLKDPLLLGNGEGIERPTTVGGEPSVAEPETPKSGQAEESTAQNEAGMDMFGGDEIMQKIREAEAAVRGEAAPAKEAPAGGARELAPEEKPSSLEELPPEIQAKAEAEWVENHADKYGELGDKISDLEKQVKSLPMRQQAPLKAEIKSLTAEQKSIEEPFIEKYQKEAVQAESEARIEAETERIAVESGIKEPGITAPKNSVEARDRLNAASSLLDTLEGKERQKAVEEHNAALDYLNEYTDKNEETPISMGKKEHVKDLEINVVKFSDGKWGYQWRGNLGSTGRSGPYGFEPEDLFNTREAALEKGKKEAAEWIRGEMKRGELKGGALALSKKLLDALKAGDNLKSNDTNSRNRIRSEEDSERGGNVEEKSGGNGGTGEEPGDNMARGERELGGNSARKRLSPEVAKEVTGLEKEMREKYLATGESDVEGFTKADEVLSHLLTELELAQPGERVHIGYGKDAEVYGLSSTFPSWIPENARHREDLDYAMEAFGDVRGLSYPSDPRETKRRALADALFEQMDETLGVDTKDIRSKILDKYETNANTDGAPEEGEEEVSDEEADLRSDAGVARDALEREDALGVTHEDLTHLIEQKTFIGPSGMVELIQGRGLTKEEEELVSNFVPAGGKKGAEGRGVLDEFYTPDDIAVMMHTLLGEAGALKGELNVLEPSAGTGNLISGALPFDAKVDAFEVNGTAARILKLNHPEANVFNKPFESKFMGERGQKVAFKPEYNLVVGNPPYGSHRGTYKGLGEEPKIERYEEYFLKRALELTKDGGHVAFVMPSSFLRGGPSSAKAEISRMGTLVDAYRLPNGAFPTTDIGTDLVVFKKGLAKDATDSTTRAMAINEDRFFQSTTGTGKILGEEGSKIGRFGSENYVKGTLEEAADKFFEGRIMEKVEEAYGNNEEAVEGATQDLFSSYKPKDYIENLSKGESSEPIENAKPETKLSEKVNKTSKKESALLDLSTLSTAKDEEAKEWSHITATGELTGDFNRDSAFYMNGKYYNRFNYLQGDIYEKLDQLEKDKDSITPEVYEKQKAELEKVLPEPVGVERISVSPNARFAHDLKLDEKPLSDLFIKWMETLPQNALGESNRYSIRQYVENIPVRGGDKVHNETERRTRRAEGDRLFKLFLTDELLKKEQALVADSYNRQFNAYARPNYREVPLIGKIHSTFNGRPLEIKDVQLQGIGFTVNKGVGLLAHDVGVGKTMQAIIAINEILSRGWAKRPLVVVPSVNVFNQWAKEIGEIIPEAKVNFLANLGGDFKGDLATLEIPEGSISLITEEGFKRLGFSNETYENLTSDFHDVISNPNDKGTARSRALEENQAEGVIGKGKKGTLSERSFEELGFDHLTVDEVHNANHIIARAKMEEGKVSEFRGFQAQPSLFGIKTWLASQYILKNNAGRNVILLSATPFTNNPLEYYSVLSLMARERMRRMGIYNVNDFMTMFMDISTLPEFKADGSYVEKSEVRSFKNYQQFQKLLTEFIDFRDGEEAGVKRPERHPREYIVGETKEGYDYKVMAQELFKDKDAGTLKAIGELRAIAFSPYMSRYYEGKPPTATEFVENSPKIKTAVDIVSQSLKDNPEAGQLIYSTIGVEYFPLIKEYLEQKLGLRKGEVEIISGATPKSRRSTIQENFNDGEIKVILGSDAIQEGVNLQRNTTDLYLLSQPWNFTAVKQVVGRAWRQGNRWPRIRVNNLFTENSIDVFLSQKLENKAARYAKALEYKGDTLDVGDISYDELKLDLITDPVVRTDLEYKGKIQELEMEAKKLQSEVAFKNRKGQKLIEAQEKLTRYEDWLKDSPSDYWKRLVAEERAEVEKVKAELKDKGVDVASVEADIAAGDAEVAKIRTKIEALNKEREAKMKEAERTRADTLSGPSDIDTAKFVAERAEDNASFYHGGPMFERMYSSLPTSDLGEAPAGLVSEAEIEAFRIFIAQGGRITPDIKPLLDSAAKKYLDYTGQPSYTRALSTQILEALGDRKVVSKQFISDLTKTKGIREAEVKAITEALDEMPAGDTANVELFGGKVASKLLEIEVGSVRTGSDNAMYEGLVTLDEKTRGDVKEYLEKVYTSPIKNRAGDVHNFSEVDNYFAHTRVEDMRDGVRRVLEVQSDLFQKGYLDSELKSDRLAYEAVQARKAAGLPVQEEESFKDPEERLKEVEALRPYANTWHERVIQEEVREAGKKGIKVLQFPTGETIMQIEGLGKANRWYLPRADAPISDGQNLKVGQEIQQGGGGAHNEDASLWIITDVLGDGKFKAVPKSATEKPNFKDDKDLYEETFDISSKVDESNPIFKFYEGEVARYLRRIRPDLTRITDSKGVSWFKTEITPEDAVRPVMAFQKMAEFDAFKYQATSFDDAKKMLEEYKSRLKLNFNVDFAHMIFTGEEGGRAYGVTYNNKITLAENVNHTTAHHELVHLIMNNLEELPVFSEFKRTELLRAANGGRDFTNDMIPELNERIAVMFEHYVAGRAQKMANIFARFFQALKDMLTDFYKSLGGKIDVLHDFYDRLARGEGKEPVEFTTRPERDEQVRRVGPSGEIILDFSKLRAEQEGIEQAYFERLKEDSSIDEDHPDLRRKDINVIESVLAQARDIYLKDPNEFAAAKVLQDIGDGRRMQKSALDQRASKKLAPYLMLDKPLRDKVDEVLMKGDEDAKEYTDTELSHMGLSGKQIGAYKSVREQFNVAHELLLSEMASHGVPDEELDQYRQERVGYMPRKWDGRFAIKEQRLTDKGVWRTESMDTFKREKEAEKEFALRKSANVNPGKTRFTLDTLDNVDVDFFSQQHLSFEAMKSAIAQARTPEEVKEMMLEAVRNMFKEKGFGRHFIRRTGVKGYKKDNVPQLVANYFAGLNGFLTKMEAGKKYYSTLSTIDARRQAKFYAFARDLIAYDMGSSVHSVKFRIPGTPVSIDMKAMVYAYHIANNISFLLSNSTQNLIVGTGELSKYMKGSQKIIGPEAMILKATADWVSGKVTAEERAIVEGLIQHGRLGGQMTAELMGFKNNPLYHEISSNLNKALYKSVALTETHINRIPAFLAARRLFIEQGLTEKEANEKALAVSDDIHFRYGAHNEPVYSRGRKSILFVFTHYMRSLLFQLYRDLSQREFLAFGRKLFYTFALAGAEGLPFATTFLALYHFIFKTNNDQQGQDEISKWKLALEKGIPAALAGVDLSGRLGINLMSIDSIINNPTNVASYLGAGAGVLKKWHDAFVDIQQGRYVDALGTALPAFIGNPIKGYAGYEYGVLSAAGTPLTDANGDVFKYNTYQALLKGAGFTPTEESLLWEAKSAQWNAQSAKQAATTNAAHAIKTAVIRGDLETARELQDKARADGIISAKTDYILAAMKDSYMKDAYDAYVAGTHSKESLRSAENNLIDTIYGANPTDSQKNGVRKQFAVYRVFGMDNDTVNKMLSSTSLKQEVALLQQAKASMDPDAFKQFYANGRKTLTLASGKSSYILISNALDKEFKSSPILPKSAADGTPTYSNNQKTTNSNVISNVLTYAKAIGTDPVTAFERIFQNQRIEKVTNGTIIIKRNTGTFGGDTNASSDFRKSQGATSNQILDHIIPVELGGSDSPDNFQIIDKAKSVADDQVENFLGTALKNGRITKSKAQDLIVKYKKGEITANDVYNY